MPTIEELVIAITPKLDTKALDKAREVAKARAQETEDAYKTAMKEVQKAQDQMALAHTAAQRGAARESIRLAKLTARAAKESMDEAKQAAKGAEQAATQAADKMKGQAKQWGDAWRMAGSAVASLGLAVGASEILSFGKEVVEQSISLHNWSERLGESTDALQRLTKAGGLANVPMEVILKSIQKLQGGLGEFHRTGAGPAGEAIKALGLNVQDIMRLPAEEQLRVIADAMRKVGSDAERTAVLVKLFGEEGAAMGQFMGNGAQGIDQLTAAVEKAGGVLDKEAIEKMVATQQQTQVLTLQIQAFAAGVVGQAVPAISEFISDLQTLGGVVSDVGGSMDENTDAVEENSAAWDLLATFGLGPISVGFQATIRLIDEVTGALRKMNEQLIPSAVAGSKAAVAAKMGPELQRIGAAEQTLDAQRRTLAESAGMLSAAYLTELSPVDQQDTEANVGWFKTRDRAKKKGGGGGAKVSANERAMREQVSAGPLGSELRKLGEQFKASDKAVTEAIKSAAASMARGANENVARKAALSSLGGMVGEDLTKISSIDPTMADLFGVSGLPNVPLSEITGNRTPQVLSATITNTFTISMPVSIDGSRRPDLIPDQVRAAVTDLHTELAKASRYVNITRDR